ncbi:MAG: hypothetical protein FD121_1308 [Gallionellaceae bacterium]|nr:MAG: hypothetical protein FD121_1308 [Gallionellaceae bacterium]
MKSVAVSHLKDADLQKVPQALLRAAEKARQLAEQTGTPFGPDSRISRAAEAPKVKGLNEYTQRYKVQLTRLA